MSMEKMIAKLIEWGNAYDMGTPLVSDKEYDELYFKLQQLEKDTGIILSNSPTQKINYTVVSELKKVKHSHSMLSLAKTKDWNAFLSYFSNIDPAKDVIGMLKLDGLTCSLRYEGGKLVGAETRGNGEVGEDIFHNALVIPSIPKTIPYEKPLVVDGEIICRLQNFQPFANEYSNPRNFASGSIRLLDSSQCAKRGLEFMVWNVIQGIDETNSLIDKFVQIESMGFNVVHWTSSFDMDAKEHLQETAKKYGIPIDGLVGRFDDIEFGKNLGATGHHAKAAYAFKFYDEDYETTLRGIQWTMGRTGILTPVAVFDPVDDGVSIIERASLHNISIMEEQLYIPYIGERIWVYKANQIIPQISKHLWTANEYDPEKNICAIPETCPYCGGETRQVATETGYVLMCANTECSAKEINKIEHFYGKKGMDVKGLSTKCLELAFSNGWINNYYDVLSLKSHVNEWTQIEGWGEISVSNIINALDNMINNDIELYSFISGIGIPNIGITAAKQIAKHYETWDAFRASSNFENCQGIGGVLQSNILGFDYTIADKMIKEFKSIVNSLYKKAPVAQSLKVAITGALNHFKNRKELQTYIQSIGWSVSSSVSAKTNYLIANEPEVTTKFNNAIKYSVPIITEDELLELTKNFSIDNSNK